MVRGMGRYLDVAALKNPDPFELDTFIKVEGELRSQRHSLEVSL
jgi:hypothetical protein